MSDLNRELADFLRRSRAAVDPSTAGLPADGRIRRVPGLRREEVALLANVSTDYYTRLEQGRRISPTAGVVDAIAAALHLDDAGRSHLGHLIGASGPSGPRRVPTVQRVRPGLHQFLAGMDSQPAFILGRRADVLASNRLANALLADFDQMPPRERNYARWVLLDERARDLFLDWEVQARAAVENLRLEVAKDPHDQSAADLVADLGERSPEFRRWWSEHRVYQRTHGTKRLRHPLVGELTISYESLTFPGDPDQVLFVYSTDVGTSSHEAMRLLASWHAPTRARPSTLPPA